MYLVTFEHTRLVYHTFVLKTKLFLKLAYCMAAYLTSGCLSPEDYIWYFLFILFVPYAMLPLPLRWCMIAGTVSAFGHVLVTFIVGNLCEQVGNLFIVYTFFQKSDFEAMGKIDLLISSAFVIFVTNFKPREINIFNFLYRVFL